jgi:Fungal specific transcription factor domain
MSILHSPNDNQEKYTDEALPPGSLSFVDPPLQTELLEEFFIWQNSWPLLIHEPFFRRDLADNGSNGYCAPTLLLSILSLSAQYSRRQTYDDLNWSALTSSLAQRAKEVVLAHIESPSFSLAHATALTSLREFSVGNINSASQHIGRQIPRSISISIPHSYNSRNCSSARLVTSQG